MTPSLPLPRQYASETKERLITARACIRTVIPISRQGKTGISLTLARDRKDEIPAHRFALTGLPGRDICSSPDLLSQLDNLVTGTLKCARQTFHIPSSHRTREAGRAAGNSVKKSQEQ